MLVSTSIRLDAILASVLAVVGLGISSAALGADGENRPIEVRTDGYVSSRACRSCHPGNYTSWSASYHSTMTQLASAKTAVGDFDNVHLEAHHRTYDLSQRGDELWVELEDPDWKGPPASSPRVERRIVMSTGSHHEQLYWFEAVDNRALGLFPLLYLIEAKRWIPFPSNFLSPSVKAGHRVPYSIGDWNRTCINCHATHGRQRIRANGMMDTDVAEFGIACESCHGPGKQHVEENRNPATRYMQHLGDRGGNDLSVVNPSKLSAERASQVCGQCHSFLSSVLSTAGQASFNRNGGSYRPGDDLTRTNIVANPHVRDAAMIGFEALDPKFWTNSFWSDGELRVTGREYISLVDSSCFSLGAGDRQLSCLSCHQMHKSADDPRTLEEWRDDQLNPAAADSGDRVCAGCHAAIAENLTGHSHHRVESAGSRCQNCHMPHASYGLLKAIRSHRIHSPSATESVETGRPNACNLCHLDRPLAWTAERLESWYEIPQPPLSEDEQRIAAGVLWLLKGDAAQRAITAWNFGWAPAQKASGTKWQIPYLAQLLNDPYDAIRYVAYRSLRAQPGYKNLEYDFMAPPRDRAEVRKKLWRGWHRTRTATNRPTGPALLTNSDGTLQWQEFQRLVGQRDDTEISLTE